MRSSTAGSPRLAAVALAKAGDHDSAGEPDHADHSTPHQAATHRLPHCGPHDFVDADRRSTAGHCGTLRGYVATGTFPHLAVLDGKEDHDGCGDSCQTETDAHTSIIGLVRSTVPAGRPPKTNQAISASTMMTMAAMTHGIFDRRRANNDCGGGGATFGSVVGLPQR